MTVPDKNIKYQHVKELYLTVSTGMQPSDSSWSEKPVVEPKVPHESAEDGRVNSHFPAY
jgi:hypothetical protein